MKYAYLLKYKVNYVYETKYKLFSTIENAINFHRNYKHHLLENAYITHYEILVMEIDMQYENNLIEEKLRGNIYINKSTLKGV